MRIIVAFFMLMAVGGTARAKKFALVPHAQELAKVPVESFKVTHHGEAGGYWWTSTQSRQGGVIVNGQRRAPEGTISRLLVFDPKGKLEHSSVVMPSKGGGFRYVELGKREAPPEIAEVIAQVRNGGTAKLELPGGTWSAVPTHDGYDVTVTRPDIANERVFRVRHGQVEALVETQR
jgi:hypothetical protein